MGLDTIEMVMQIEEEFSIEVPDVVASELITVGDFAQYLEESTKGMPTDTNYNQACNRIIEILVDDYRVNPKGITAKSRFVKDLGLD